MTKSSKLIATLGVVAGLGVAALPLGSVFATQTPATTSGNVDLYVEVQPAIAMTISGNNDNHLKYDGTHTEGALDVFGPANSNYPTTKYIVDDHTENHVGDEATNTTYSSSYAQILPQSVLLGDRSASSPVNDFGSTVTIYTNSATGYNLNLEDSDSTTALTQITNIPSGGAAETIDAGTTLTAGTSNWAYKVTPTAVEAQDDAAGTSDKTTWTAITAKNAGVTVAHEDNKTNDGTEYIVDYAVSTSADQATGVYSDTIVYTATTK